jgi:hypothetical protein
LVLDEQSFLQHSLEYSFLNMLVISPVMCKRYQFQIPTTLKAVNVWGTFMVFLCLFKLLPLVP